MSEFSFVVVSWGIGCTLGLSCKADRKGWKRLDLCMKRDPTVSPFGSRVRDNDAGNTVCRFLEILRNWSPRDVPGHPNEALGAIRRTDCHQWALMTISERVNTVFCTQTSSYNGAPWCSGERETKTCYFCASGRLSPNAPRGLCEDSMVADTGLRWMERSLCKIIAVIEKISLLSKFQRPVESS